MKTTPESPPWKGGDFWPPTAVILSPVPKLRDTSLEGGGIKSPPRQTNVGLVERGKPAGAGRGVLIKEGTN